MSKLVKRLFIIVSCLYCFILPWGIVSEDEPLVKPNWQVSNGEYLHKDFVDNTEVFNDLRTHVYDNDKNSYEYTVNKGVVTVKIDEPVPEGKLLIPKIWYKGYHAYTFEGEELKCRMGYSQFVLVEVGDYTGEIKVQFRQSYFLIVLSGLVFAYIIDNLWNYIKDTFTKNKDACYNNINKLERK